MYNQLIKRIDELLNQGQAIIRPYGDNDFWARDVAEAQAWMASAANTILQVSPHDSFFHTEIIRLTSDSQLRNGIPLGILKKVQGILKSVQTEAQNGLLAKLEYQVFATAFDDFLDHASQFHKSGKAKEAAILVSAVLEDTLKRVAFKNNIDPAGYALEPLIDELAKIGIFTPVKAKRMKSYSGVRNAALHAEWEKLDLKDIGNVIEGVRELLDGFL